jgi:ribonuclease III
VTGVLAQLQTVDALEARLGYCFANKQLLIRSLTHASARSAGMAPHDNERLEFLGDRVLGLAMAELIYTQFPDDDEGDLARRFNQLVRRQSCAKIARDWGLGDDLRLGLGERTADGIKDTILADACEAVLAAVFLDGGFAAARDLVCRSWAPLVGAPGKVGMDAKTMLQERAQGRDQRLPAYVEIGRSGPAHAPRFVAEVRLNGVAPASGEGSNKRAAEQAAARALLLREGVWTENDG